MGFIDEIRNQLNGMGALERQQAIMELREVIYEDAYAQSRPTSEDVTACPSCGSVSVVRKGHDRDGIQRWMCKDRHRTFRNEPDTIITRSKLKPAVRMKYLERFVGFYLPYWSFRSKTEREMHVDGVKRTRRGDYIYVDHYHLSGKLDASYDGVSYDASSSFDDGISQRIAPFSTKNMVDFAPSFLLGFYADTADVPVEIYQNEAYTTIAKDIVRRLLSSQGFQKGGIKVESSATAQIRNEIAGDISSERMMFPIWFLTYRKGDRIAYSVVNGSTGTIYSDLPIDSGRFFRASLLFAIPIFLLLNLILSLSAQKILIFSMLLAVFTIFLYAMEIRAIHRKEKRKDDTGYQWKQKDEAKSASAEAEDKDMQGENMTEEYQRRSQARNTERVPAKHTHFTEMLGAVFAVLLSALILFWNPVEDLFFYLGSVASLLSIGITILGVIKKYNNFATRPVPDFFTKKGE